MFSPLEMRERLLISGLAEQDFNDFKRQNTFSSQLTFKNIEEFFESCGVSVSNIHLCNSNYAIPTIIFTINCRKYIFLYSDVSIAIQDIQSDNYYAEIKYDEISIYTLANLLQDSWLYFMYKKFDYTYLFAYPLLSKHILKVPNYISEINNYKLEEWILDFLCTNNTKTNNFYHENPKNLAVKELPSIHDTIRRFVITKKSTKNIFYICLSDFEIVYPDISQPKFLVFMYNHFGPAYLNNLRDYLITKLNQIYIPRYIEKQTQKIDKIISTISEISSHPKDSKKDETPDVN